MTMTQFKVGDRVRVNADSWRDACASHRYWPAGMNSYRGSEGAVERDLGAEGVIVRFLDGQSWRYHRDDLTLLDAPSRVLAVGDVPIGALFAYSGNAHYRYRRISAARVKVEGHNIEWPVRDFEGGECRLVSDSAPAPAPPPVTVSPRQPLAFGLVELSEEIVPAGKVKGIEHVEPGVNMTDVRLRNYGEPHKLYPSDRERVQGLPSLDVRIRTHVGLPPEYAKFRVTNDEWRLPQNKAKRAKAIADMCEPGAGR